MAPTVAGILADKYCLSVPMPIVAGGMCVVIILAFFLKETAPRFADR